MYTPVSIFKCVQGGCFCNNNGTKNNDHNNNSDSSTLSNPYVPGTRMCDVQFSRWLREGGIINHISPIGRLRHRGVRRSAHGHVADKWHSWEFSSRLGGFRSASHWGGRWFEGKTGHNCVRCHRWGSTCTGYWVCVGPLALTVAHWGGLLSRVFGTCAGEEPKGKVCVQCASVSVGCWMKCLMYIKSLNCHKVLAGKFSYPYFAHVRTEVHLLHQIVQM